MELERGDIEVDTDIQVSDENENEIIAYLETWFDVDKKFHIHTNADEGTWLNMYGIFDPFEDTLRVQCEISREDGYSYFDYEPTSAEAQMIKERIIEKLKAVYGQTPQEFCEGLQEGPIIGGIK
ncbi:MAG: hypothetical protein HFE93_07820 [Acutalibacter muris]|jgi:hypothetical protein|nr:hypothetical protein [Acutalibacter muris]MCI9544083.1 hypothetical protein [Acutalibacter muris]